MLLYRISEALGREHFYVWPVAEDVHDQFLWVPGFFADPACSIGAEFEHCGVFSATGKDAVGVGEMLLQICFVDLLRGVLE